MKIILLLFAQCLVCIGGIVTSECESQSPCTHPAGAVINLERLHRQAVNSLGVTYTGG